MDNGHLFLGSHEAQAEIIEEFAKDEQLPFGSVSGACRGVTEIVNQMGTQPCLPRMHAV